MGGGIEASTGWRVVAVPFFYTLLFCSLFAPVLLTGGMLAPGDALVGYLPAFRSSHALWEPLLGGGFPLAAEGSSQRFYPPAILASWLDAWNALVIAAYVIAASATCAFVFELTRSAFASLLSGIFFAMSALLIIHLPHLTQIHAAAWVPLALWAFERQRRRPSRAGFLAAALAVACGALAGHPQNFVNGFSLAGAYALVMGGTAQHGRRRYWSSVAAAACLGLGVAAVQWIPMLELGSLSHRPRLDFATFVSYSLPTRQAAQIFFPFLFGGASAVGPFAPEYYGRWNLGELAGYVGFAPWTLALIAVLRHGERRLVWFWSAAALVSFALALGDDAPLARITHWIPPYNRLRCPARHLLETTMSIAVLAGLGVSALQQRRAGGRLALRVSVAVLAGAALLLPITQLGLRMVPAAEAWASIAASFRRPAVYVPLSLGALAIPVLVSFARDPTSRRRAVVLAGFAVLDLASFAWFVDWRVRPPAPELLHEPAWLTSYSDRLRAENQRLVTFHPASEESGMPNITWLWKVPNAAVYPQLAVGRQRELLPLENGLAPFCTGDRTLDLLAVRYAPRPRVRRLGFEWEPAIDRGCGDGGLAERAWTLPDVSATRIGLVASLGRAVSVEDGTLAATLQVETADGLLRLPIRAGEHVSEWAYDRADVKPHVRHRQARLFESAATVDELGRPFHLQSYLAELELGGRHAVRRLAIRAEPGISLRVDHVSIADGDDSQPVASGLVDPARWRLAGIAGPVRVYENLRALPRAWLVDRTMMLAPDAILRAVHTSRLPDGSAFDPRALALVDDEIDTDLTTDGDPGAPAGEVDSIRIEDESIELRTRAPGARLLVLGDVYYPGWTAAIDGAPARVHPANYALRAVAVPAGEHRVRFEFRPASFRIGAAIAIASLVLLGGIVAFSRFGSLDAGERR